jgi:hypothetical protein
MTWADVFERRSDTTLRQFGWMSLAAAVVVVLLRTGGGRPDLFGGLLLGLGGLLACGGTVRPALVRPVFVAALLVTFPIGLLVSRGLLMLLFWGIVTPIALVFRASGRDVLRRRRQARATYWEPGRPGGTPDSYFRQW